MKQFFPRNRVFIEYFTKTLKKTVQIAKFGNKK